jgi:polar amino acid transport system substrate-binding protein
MEKISSGQADIACGASFSWQRAREFNFSLPFALGGVRLLVTDDVDGTPESIDGKEIGVVKDSATAALMKDVVPGATFIEFNTASEGLQALKTGSIRNFAGDSLRLKANMADVPNAKLVPALPYGPGGISCVTAGNNHELDFQASVAIAQMLQSYIDGDPGSMEQVNRWVGPGSKVNVPQPMIEGYFRAVLSTAAEISVPIRSPDADPEMAPSP